MAENIPAPTFTLDQLTQNFAAKGLTQEEMVMLSGTYACILHATFTYAKHPCSRS